MVGASRSGTIDSATSSLLGEASAGKVGTWIVQFTNNSFSGSVTVKAKVVKGGATPTAIAYTDLSDGSTGNTAAITGAALISVDSAGMEVSLDCTSYTSGSLGWNAVPVVG